MRLRAWSRVVLATVLLVCGCGLRAQQAAQFPGQNQALPLVYSDNGKNSAAAQHAHYVVLVSLDGFRWDYAERDHAAHLLALGRQGVWAPQGMLPSYPSLTFPNHLTIVTGLYPGHHGIVANSFYDPARGAWYSYQDPETMTDGSWYGGVPLWSLAESQHMRSACLFWPGSEAKIAGYRPTWYAQFDAKTQGTAEVQQSRIDDAVALLKLPAEERPHLIVIYYSEPDHEGHEYGPDAAETRAAALRMDRMVGKLKAALDATGLPIDLVVVSDHGMVKTDGGWVTLDKFADLSRFKTDGALMYGATEEDRERAYDQLKKATSEFVAYRLKNVPAELNVEQNARMGDPVVVATGPYAIRARSPRAGDADAPPPMGMYGFDATRMPEMKASFFAAGPDILEGKTVAPFENVNLYPWLAHLLGLSPPKTDGSLHVLSGALRDGGN